MKSRTVWFLALIILLVAAAAGSQSGGDLAAAAGPISGSDLGLPDLAEGDVVCADDSTAANDRTASGEGVYYADCAAGYKAAGGSKYVGKANSNPATALGPPDYLDPVISPGVVSLGNAEGDAQSDPRNCDGYLILEFTAVNLYDGPGDDLRIFEAGTSVGGVTEPTFVYVSPNDEGKWYYIGRTDLAESFGRDVVSMDIAGSNAPSFETFRYVALCDVADGITSGWPVGGPDIDAVEAVNWTYEKTAPALMGTSIGDGNVINDRPMPDGETREVGENDRVKGTSYGEIKFQKHCRQTIEANLLFAAAYNKSDPLKAAYHLAIVYALMQDCQFSPAAAGMDTLELALEDGGIALQVPTENLELTMSTTVVSATSSGRAQFDVIHDQKSNSSTVEAKNGVLDIVPAKAGSPPFQLEEGYTVVITADSVGEVFADASSYLPMVRGD